MSAPNDIARCDGRMASSASGFVTISTGHSECVRCLRRTAPRDKRVWLIVTPAFNSFGKCPMRVGEEKQ